MDIASTLGGDGRDRPRAHRTGVSATRAGSATVALPARMTCTAPVGGRHLEIDNLIAGAIQTRGQPLRGALPDLRRSPAISTVSAATWDDSPRNCMRGLPTRSVRQSRILRSDERRVSPECGGAVRSHARRGPTLCCGESERSVEQTITRWVACSGRATLAPAGQRAGADRPVFGSLNRVIHR